MARKKKDFKDLIGPDKEPDKAWYKNILPKAGETIRYIWDRKWKILTLNFKWNKNLNLGQNVFRNSILPNSRGKRSMHVMFAVWIMMVLTYMTIGESSGKSFSTEAWVAWTGLTGVILGLFAVSEYQKRTIGTDEKEDEQEFEAIEDLEK